MNALDRMPECKIFWVERQLSAHGARAQMLEGREDSDGELAFVVRVDDPGTWPDPTSARERGFATLVDGQVAIEWASTARHVAAAFSRALKRLGWAKSIHAWAVYGEAS